MSTDIEIYTPDDRRPEYKYKEEYTKCSYNDAVIFARILVGCYRDVEHADNVTFIAGVIDTLTRYPRLCVARVCHPSGLPSKLKWLPSIAELVEMLNDEHQRLTEEAVKPDLRVRLNDLQLEGPPRTRGPFIRALELRLKEKDPVPSMTDLEKVELDGLLENFSRDEKIRIETLVVYGDGIRPGIRAGIAPQNRANPTEAELREPWKGRVLSEKTIQYCLKMNRIRKSAKVNGWKKFGDVPPETRS